MDGNIASREDTEAMFDKITGFMQYIRDQLVSNTQLAKDVEAMQAQVSELNSRIDSVVSQNTALQEAVNVLTQERNQALEAQAQTQLRVVELEAKFTERDNDANHWYAEFQKVSAELERIKSERSKLEEDHLALMDVHEKTKTKLEQIQHVLGPLATVEEIQKRSEPQPRDPDTQQWRSYNVG